MIVAFRADASLQIGTGHVMRCLTLADALHAQGVECHFIMRLHPGNMVDVVRQRGFIVHTLPSEEKAGGISASAGGGQPSHAHWLGCHWRTDAEQTGHVLRILRPRWLVVDHYALDAGWEGELAPLCEKIMVIDDLADRSHYCNLLLDQTHGRTAQQYGDLLSGAPKVLIGPQYALLRPEFAALRSSSLRSRRNPVLRRILVTMGGVDQHNVTSAILRALGGCPLPEDCRIKVVLGLSAPWVREVQALASTMPNPTEVLINVSDMAGCMVESDLAIGAAGGTSWERCCLGLPTLLVVLAENQKLIAESLVRSGAVLKLNHARSSVLSKEMKDVISSIIAEPTLLRQLSEAAASITTGEGAQLVAEAMVSESFR